MRSPLLVDNPRSGGPLGCKAGIDHELAGVQRSSECKHIRTCTEYCKLGRDVSLLITYGQSHPFVLILSTPSFCEHEVEIGGNSLEFRELNPRIV